MINISIQQQPDGTIKPFSKEDAEALKVYKPNQVLRAKISGTTKERSIPQLRLFFACCRTIVDNTDDINWNSVDKVKNQIKVELQFIDLNKSIVDPSGAFHPHYRSICFEELRHMDACNFFDRGFIVLAKKIGITVDELLQNAERHG